MTDPVLVSPEVQLPDHLNGDPRQPASLIPSGPWVEIGEKDLSIDQVYDPEYSQAIQDYSIWDRDTKDRDYAFYLNRASVTRGYRIYRQQRWELSEAPDRFIIDKGEELELTVTTSYGSVVNQANDTSRTVGISVGNTTTVKAGAKASAGVSYGPFNGSVEISAEVQKENSKTFQQELRMGESRSDTNTNDYSSTYKKTFSGGEQGWRYVFYKIVDRFKVVRINTLTKELFDINGDDGLVSDVWVSSINQSMRYSLDQ